MKWLPSFVKLFLIFVAGIVLMFVGAVVSMQHPGNSALGSAFDILRLVGLAMMLISPLLIALKFFAQLDRKAK